MSEITGPVSEINYNGVAVPLSAINGLPAGGTTDQILAKASDTDYDTKWVDAGGSADNIYVAEAQLIKNADGTFAIGENNIDYETLNIGILDGTYKTAMIKLLGDVGYSYLYLSQDMYSLFESVNINGYNFQGYYLSGEPKEYDVKLTVQDSSVGMTLAVTEKSSGNKKYEHNILLQISTATSEFAKTSFISFKIINNTNNLITTFGEIKNYLANNFTSRTNYLEAHGALKLLDSEGSGISAIITPFAIYYYSESQLVYMCSDVVAKALPLKSIRVDEGAEGYGSGFTIYDTVIEL